MKTAEAPPTVVLKRPVKTRATLEREARELCALDTPKFNFTEWRRRNKK